MENKKTGALNLGAKGLVLIILAFFTCYVYSALTSDSLNVTREVFARMGVSINVIAMMSTIAVFTGIVASIIFGKLMSVKSASLFWGVTMLVTGIFAVIWGNVHSNGLYIVCHLVVASLVVVAAQLLSYQVLACWYPTKRGVAMGICTMGYPLSAATTTAVAGTLVGVGHGSPKLYYAVMGIIAIIVAIIVFVFAKDFPEEKGCYPDNNRNFDFAAAQAEHEANLAYLKTSKWTVGKCFTTGRMWILWLSVGITGFLSMGIMSNFVGKFMEQGYQMPQILSMLGIAGVVAIPGSFFVGWLDVKIGTKKTGILVNALAVVAVAFNLTSITPLHYISLPILALMLGGSSNLMVSCTAAIWGRYDYQNAFRVIQPLNSIMTGIGITVVTLVGNHASYWTAYAVMLIMAIVGLIAMAALKVEPIDKDVR